MLRMNTPGHSGPAPDTLEHPMSDSLSNNDTSNSHTSDPSTAFDNVSVVKAANIYFDGKVTSRVLNFADGSRKTLGIMMPGEYTFGTEEKEIMEILAGEMAVLLPGQTEWQTFTQGSSFEVPANSSFDLKVKSVIDYCCAYIP